MGNTLIHARCLNHGDREAVARCPECIQFYCRECISEFNGRVVCSSCLKKSTGIENKKRGSLAWLLIPFYLGIAIFVSTLFFYTIGQALIKIPSSFHDGTVWQKGKLLSD
ncbi:MAG: rhomboid family protein [Verrucomicrobiales bacterium]|nr:rhomboid family protein [Verrucomicrobiales bacterium]MDB6130549.1 rhomboid family protein [Verrucomicrobiales bacterium]